MSSFEFSRVMKLTKFELKTNRKTVIGWSIAMFSIMFLYMILFPTMKDIAQIKMDAMPKEILEFVGMGDMESMLDFVAYFTMVFKLLSVAICIFAATFCSGIINRQEKNKTLEFLSCVELGRSEIYVSKLITSFIAMVIVILSAMVAAIICGFINGGDTFVLMDVIAISKSLGFAICFFGSLGLFLAATSRKIGSPVVGSMTVVVSYMLGYLSVILKDKAEWLKYLSPIDIFGGTGVLEMTREFIVSMGVYFAIMIIMLVAGNMIFNRRDYKL